jgi:hypothetical protein
MTHFPKLVRAMVAYLLVLPLITILFALRWKRVPQEERTAIKSYVKFGTFDTE